MEGNIGVCLSVSAQATSTYLRTALQNRLCSMGVGARGIYAPGKVARVSGARLMWPCVIDQDRGVGRCLVCILRGWKAWVGLGVGVEETQQGPYEVKQERQSLITDNYQSNKFLLRLMVGQLAFWH